MPQNSRMLLPLSALNNRSLSIQESVILYLAQQGLSITGIAQMLLKHTSTVWTTLHRAQQKVMRQ